MLCLLLLFLPACENKAENDVPETDRSVPVTEAPETTTIKKEVIPSVTVTEAVETTTEYRIPDPIPMYRIPEYTGDAYTELNGNKPWFAGEEFSASPFEYYSDLDPLGRCGFCVACLGKELMPTDEREDISSIIPSGWQGQTENTADGGMLYNRCHLIGYQLSGENANRNNIITGTAFMNTVTMLRFENTVYEYINGTGNHVLYRVTPIYSGNELVARGVEMEAYSVEDNGAGVSFNVFCFNVQPGMEIDYRTGEPVPTTEPEPSSVEEYTYTERSVGTEYILNKNTHKFHYRYCSSVSQMNEKNKIYFTGTRDEAISQGYVPCKKCNP